MPPGSGRAIGRAAEPASPARARGSWAPARPRDPRGRSAS
jgi:hypothetical protein